MSEAAEGGWCALVVDDDAAVRQSLRLCIEPMGGRVLGVGSTSAALDALARSWYDVVLVDLWLDSHVRGGRPALDILPEMLKRQPETGVIVITAFATFENAVEAIKRGASDYLPKPFTPDQVRVAVDRVLSNRRLKGKVAELEARLAGYQSAPWFDSQDPQYNAFLHSAAKAAAADSTVLLLGESGTGKNVVAHRMRTQSARRERPFITVHCPTLPPDSMSRVLFGSDESVGKVQEAESGTLFLDEIGDLTLDAQARLLRLLGEHSYERVGEGHERRADVRVMAATNHRLEELVASGKLREDLLFRLNVVSLTVPPLRQRQDDILPLAAHFLRFFAPRRGRNPLTLSPRAQSALCAHMWPGNVRELRNGIERAAVLAAADVIEPVDLGLAEAVSSVQLGALVSLEELEKEHIARVITRTPTLEAAARILGIDATTLQRKRKRFGLT